MQYKKTTAILLAVLAAAFYAVNVPVSKLLLKEISPTFLASLLYFGAGIGIGLLYCINPKSHRGEKKLTRKDLPYTLGMILLDIAAPILLMLGLKSASSANASLLGNFEIAATTLIALLLFREKVSKRLWAAILLITLSSGILSFEDMSSLHFSRGSLLVLAAAACWGLENNCTRNISDKSTFEIVFLKGIFSGLGSFLIALYIGEPFPGLHTAAAALLLGFVAYGLSIFCYVRSQNTLGAAKTSAYYAIAPFIGTALSCIIWHDALTVQYFLALAVMLLGSVLVVLDTLQMEHTHSHTHTFTHTHDGVTHSHHYPQPPALPRHARGKSPAPPHHAHAAAFTQLIAAPVTPVRLFPAAARTPARTAPERFPETARFPAAFPAKSGRTIPAEKLP